MTRDEKDNRLADIMVVLEDHFPCTNYKAIIILADIKQKELALFSNILESEKVLDLLIRATEVERTKTDFGTN